MIDIRPAADRTAMLVTSVADEQLDLPTPCPDTRLGDLIDHVGSLSRAFLASARKEAGDRNGPPPAPDAANLGPGWRDQIAGDLHALAAAWQQPEAWEGLTKAGGIDLPAQVAGLSPQHRSSTRPCRSSRRSRRRATAASSVRSSRSPTPPRRSTG
jgi:uncharacterized protein (TIGR03086 family)